MTSGSPFASSAVIVNVLVAWSHFGEMFRSSAEDEAVPFQVHGSDAGTDP